MARKSQKKKASLDGYVPGSDLSKYRNYNTDTVSIQGPRSIVPGGNGATQASSVSKALIMWLCSTFNATGSFTPNSYVNNMSIYVNSNALTVCFKQLVQVISKHSSVVKDLSSYFTATTWESAVLQAFTDEIDMVNKFLIFTAYGSNIPLSSYANFIEPSLTDGVTRLMEIAYSPTSAVPLTQNFGYYSENVTLNTSSLTNNITALYTAFGLSGSKVVAGATGTGIYQLPSDDIYVFEVISKYFPWFRYGVRTLDYGNQLPYNFADVILSPASTGGTFLLNVINSGEVVSRRSLALQAIYNSNTTLTNTIFQYVYMPLNITISLSQLRFLMCELWTGLSVDNPARGINEGYTRLGGYTSEDVFSDNDRKKPPSSNPNGPNRDDGSDYSLVENNGSNKKPRLYDDIKDMVGNELRQIDVGSTTEYLLDGIERAFGITDSSVAKLIANGLARGVTNGSVTNGIKYMVQEGKEGASKLIVEGIKNGAKTGFSMLVGAIGTSMARKHMNKQSSAIEPPPYRKTNKVYELPAESSGSVKFSSPKINFKIR